MAGIAYSDTKTTGLEAWHDMWEVGLVWPDGREELYHVQPALTFADRNVLRISGFYRRTRHMQTPNRSDEPVCNNAHRILNTDTDRPALPRWSDPPSLAEYLAYELDGVSMLGMLPSFDAYHLDKFLRANGQAGAWHHHIIDLEPMVVGWLHGRRSALVETHGEGAVAEVAAGPPYRSDDLSIMLGVDPPDGGERHTALGDARWCRRVHEAIIGKNN